VGLEEVGRRHRVGRGPYGPTGPPCWRADATGFGRRPRCSSGRRGWLRRDV